MNTANTLISACKLLMQYRNRPNERRKTEIVSAIWHELDPKTHDGFWVMLVDDDSSIYYISRGGGVREEIVH